MIRLNAVVALAALIGTLLLVGCQQPQAEEPASQPPEPMAQPAPYPHDQIPEATEPAGPASSAQPAMTDIADPDDEPITEIEAEPAAPKPKPKTTAAKPKEKYAAPKPAGRTYVVRKGDTLQSISKKFYNTTRNWRKIHEANKSTLKDPNKLTIGTKLVIP